MSFQETSEFISQIYPEVIAHDPEGAPTNEVDQIRLEAARKTQKTELAGCRTAVAELERELYFAKKDLEKAYQDCRPLQVYAHCARVTATLRTDNVHTAYVTSGIHTTYAEIRS
eukprot:scaffold3830_cov85-Cylindrotheca_fusiformis.AAC.2